ncbi:MAG: aminoglycoside phosphotransferase, partial [Chloroflexota bacterium]
MDPLIRDRYSDGILQEAQRRYGIDPERIKPLNGFESYIFEFNRDDGDYILRLGHDSRRSADLVRGEMDF